MTETDAQDATSGPIWWDSISEAAREWLLGNLNEMIPAQYAIEIIEGGGHVVGAPGWEGETATADSFSLSNAEWDQIRSKA